MDTSTKRAPSTQSREIKLQAGVTASLSRNKLIVKGPLGSTAKDFTSIRAKISNGTGGAVKITSLGSRRKDLATLGTASSIVTNMIHGVIHGYTYKLKIAFAHFPVTVAIKDGKVNIQNFYGERVTRSSTIVGDSKVTVEGDDVIVKGINVEHVGQTAANIEQATKVKRKDQRVFLDGIYLYEKVKPRDVKKEQRE